MLASAWLSVESKRSYKIDDVRHVEGLNDVADIEEVDETHKLS
jgi:hypothetical protein